MMRVTITLQVKAGAEVDRYIAAEILTEAVRRIEQGERSGVAVRDEDRGAENVPVCRFTVEGKSEVW